MIRKYVVTIKQLKNGPQVADNVPKEFRCSISEPSAWLAPGATTERGLTFQDIKGKTLGSSLFKHQAYFSRLENTIIPENAEIKDFIYNAIQEHYQIVRKDISIKVKEVGSL